MNDIDTLKSLSNILKTNSSVCIHLGGRFLSQLNFLYLDMFSLYRNISKKMSSDIALNGALYSKTPLIRSMRVVKKDILRLIESFVNSLEDPLLFTDQYSSYLFEMTLTDYKDNIREAREPEVLNVVSSIVSRLGQRVSHFVNPILDSIFDCTLEMINKDFSEFPDHRISFFKLLRSISNSCFDGIFFMFTFLFIAFVTLPSERTKLFIDSVSWAFKHSTRQISSLGLEILSSIISQVNKCQTSTSARFYQSFFLPILQDLLYVITDADHKSGKLE